MTIKGKSSNQIAIEQLITLIAGASFIGSHFHDLKIGVGVFFIAWAVQPLVPAQS